MPRTHRGQEWTSEEALEEGEKIATKQAQGISMKDICLKEKYSIAWAYDFLACYNYSIRSRRHRSTMLFLRNMSAMLRVARHNRTPMVTITRERYEMLLELEAA